MYITHVDVCRNNQALQRMTPWDLGRRALTKTQLFQSNNSVKSTQQQVAVLLSTSLVASSTPSSKQFVLSLRRAVMVSKATV